MSSPDMINNFGPAVGQEGSDKIGIAGQEGWRCPRAQAVCGLNEGGLLDG